MAIDFKYKLLDENGNQVGLRSSKGSVDETQLVLDGESIPLVAVHGVLCRFDRLVIQLLQEGGEAAPLAIAVTGGKPPRIAEQINRNASRRLADLRRELLARQGRSFTATACPQCGATVETTGFATGPQLYCSYCDSLSTLGPDAPAHEQRYRICDECGMYACPRAFTLFYFYFLLVVYGYSYRRTHCCHTCMRPQAWKMLGANLLFVLGVPVALVQLLRACRGGGGDFTGLDRANAAAKRGNLGVAVPAYEAVVRRFPAAAGVRYNLGLAQMGKGQWEAAIASLEASLRDCPTYAPAAKALAQCYQVAGHDDALAELLTLWGEDAQEEDADAADMADAAEPIADGEQLAPA
ncbi:MAG: tetratricopeptide repeat protein [Planctomycetota bacterium]